MIRSRILIHLCKDTKLIRSKLQCSTSSAISEVDRYYKTSESNPLNHNLSHLGRLYEVSNLCTNSMDPISINDFFRSLMMTTISLQM